MKYQVGDLLEIDEYAQKRFFKKANYDLPVDIFLLYKREFAMFQVYWFNDLHNKRFPFLMNNCPILENARLISRPENENR